MLAAIAERIDDRRFLARADCAATLDCLRGSGLDSACRGAVVIAGAAPVTARATAPLDALNSGTTMRLLSGMAAGHPFRTVMTGDSSLQAPSDAPDHRTADAYGRAYRGGWRTAPLTFDGGSLHGITHEPQVPSAQVKSGILLRGCTRRADPSHRNDSYQGPYGTGARTFGASIVRDPGGVELEGGQKLRDSG
jgi:3-phosphoshikimate 1-carboxyvinyltransferase